MFITIFPFRDVQLMTKDLNGIPAAQRDQPQIEVDAIAIAKVKGKKMNNCYKWDIDARGLCV